MSLSNARQIGCKTSSFSRKVFNCLEFSFVDFWAEVAIRTRYHISYYHFVGHCGAFWVLKRRNFSLMNQWKVSTKQSCVIRSQSKSGSHYSVAPCSCSFGQRNIVQTILFSLCSVCTFFMPYVQSVTYSDKVYFLGHQFVLGPTFSSS